MGVAPETKADCVTSGGRKKELELSGGGQIVRFKAQQGQRAHSWEAVIPGFQEHV